MPPPYPIAVADDCRPAWERLKATRPDEMGECREALAMRPFPVWVETGRYGEHRELKDWRDVKGDSDGWEWEAFNGTVHVMYLRRATGPVVTVVR